MRILSTWGGLGLAVFVALEVAACSHSTSSGTGVTNAQPGGHCLPKRAACVANDDCCTLWCANGVCTTKQP
jgi:hypothetical protein